ncbi:MAG: Asp-tRNA(Asn)/Glu-tRNA(Gln) amidotransferase subunit GatA [Gammaproteobacteria bacterium]|nr:Asp-tRNA(Asn)/Glu-tRNA(Gln) amidotransferase subunit GatA [Gammaproteobacteria bacterium]MBT7753535.1 Asp-tRNA(Asn)/Glu-tRNA(Gln) amidotransferase subunit GatA [Gammaproteobacteria bacterium]
MDRFTLKKLINMISQREISSAELVSTYLDRIKKYDHSLNSFLTLNEESAREQSLIADKVIQAGNYSLLTGIPYASKDIFCTKGIRTTCASKMLENFIPPYDSTIIDRIKSSGAILMGKTNMDEFAMGSSNETSYFGPVQNPWNLERSPGGSSGGSAAAVASGIIPIALGTDTGGSIRQPAAFTGITGLKPTYGRCSRYGMIAFASSLDQAGLLALTAEDISIFLEVMSGFDPLDSTSVEQDVPKYSDLIDSSIEGRTVGIPKEFFNDSLDSESQKLLDQGIAIYEKLGAKIIEISLPNIGYSVPTYYVVASAECSSNLARYDGIRYGYRDDDIEDLDDLYRTNRQIGFGDEVKRRIMTGTYVLSAGYYDAYYLKAQKVRQLISNDFEEAFKKVDLIVGPTTQSPAFKIGEKIDDPVSMYMNDIYTISSNLAGLPALSHPIGLIDNLPIGMQLIAPHFEESRLLNFCNLFQQETDYHMQQPQAFLDASH